MLLLGSPVLSMWPPSPAYSVGFALIMSESPAQQQHQHQTVLHTKWRLTNRESCALSGGSAYQDTLCINDVTDKESSSLQSRF